VIQRNAADVPKMVTEREKQALATSYFVKKPVGHDTRYEQAICWPGGKVLGDGREHLYNMVKLEEFICGRHTLWVVSMYSGVLVQRQYDLTSPVLLRVA